MAFATAPATAASLASAAFGTTGDGHVITRHTMTTAGGVSVAFIGYGGIITDIVTPDPTAQRAGLLFGFPTLREYESRSADGAFYFGAPIGRFANWIAAERFSLDGHAYQISATRRSRDWRCRSMIPPAIGRGNARPPSPACRSTPAASCRAAVAPHRSSPSRRRIFRTARTTPVFRPPNCGPGKCSAAQQSFASACSDCHSVGYCHGIEACRSTSGFWAWGRWGRPWPSACWRRRFGCMSMIPSPPMSSRSWRKVRTHMPRRGLWGMPRRSCSPALPSPEISLAVAGEMRGAARLATYVEMSTIGRAAMEQVVRLLGGRGVAVVDARVSGGPDGARAGRLALMAAAPPAALSAVRPYLDRIASSVFEVGARRASGR